MKKSLSVLTAAFIIAASMLFIGCGKKSDTVFNTAFTLVNNEPSVKYDEWDVPYNVWTNAENKSVKAGDRVCIALTYAVPDAAELSDYSETELASIEFIINFTGLNSVEIIEAQGCAGRTECDYETGVCKPVPGEYANIVLNGNTCTIMAEVNKEVTVVFGGEAAGDTIGCKADITIGQYRFPAQFSIGSNIVTVEKSGEGCYSAHHSDVWAVQKHAVEYRNSEDGTSCDKLVALNGHYYEVIAENGVITGFLPFPSANISEPVDMQSELADTLKTIFAEYETLFGISCDDNSVSDADFLGDSRHEKFTVEALIGK